MGASLLEAVNSLIAALKSTVKEIHQRKASTEPVVES